MVKLKKKVKKEKVIQPESEPIEETETGPASSSEQEPDSEEERRLIAEFKKRQAELENENQLQNESGVDKSEKKKKKSVKEEPSAAEAVVKRRKPSATERKLLKQERNLKKKLKKIKRLEKKQGIVSEEPEDEEMEADEDDEGSFDEDNDDLVIANFWKMVREEESKKGTKKLAGKDKDDKEEKFDSKSSEKIEAIKNKIAVLENKRQAKLLQRKSQPKPSKAERKKLKKEKGEKYKLKKIRKAQLKQEAKKMKRSAGATLTEDKKDVKADMKELVKPVFNSEAKMLFSKIELPSDKMNKKKKKGKNLDPNPKRVLESIQKEKQKLRELEESGDKEKANELKLQHAWQNAFKKVEGVKTKDDVELLQKAVRKRENRKKKSKETWKQRESKVKTEQDKRIKKRQENIEKRKKSKTTNKLKKAAKRGRVIAGF